MQMQYRSVCVALLIAACGDNHGAKAPDAGADAPPPDGSAQVCSTELAASDLAGTWDKRFTVPGFTGHDGNAPAVYDFAKDTDGSILAVGNFGYLGGDHVQPMLRLRDGTWAPARTTWEKTPPPSGFSSVAVAPDGTLALATYDDFGPRSGEIWIDDGTGLRVIGKFDGLVRRLRWFNGKLWAAGWNQIHQGTTVIQGLAVWDGTAWAAPPGGPVDSFAFELVEDGGALLVGGDFTKVGGIAARGAASYNGTKWTRMSFPKAVAVYAFARGADNALYAGGAFADLGNGAGGIMRWTGTAWVEAAGGVTNRNFPGVVTDLVNHAGSLYVSGCFFTVGGPADADGAVVAPQVARYDGAWHALDTGTQGVLSPWVEPLGCGDEGPDSVWNVSKQVMISNGDQLLFGGSFPGIGGAISQAVIGYSGGTWQSQGPAGLGLGGEIDHVGVASESCDVWGAGTFTHVAGAPSPARVVHFTGDSWQVIHDDIPRDALCQGFAVSPAGDVALGCMIFPAEGDAVGRVYKVSGTELVQIGADQDLVSTVAYSPDGTLWIGGGSAGGFVAKYDGAAFVTVEAGFDGQVTQLDAVSATDVIAAGTFTKIGELAASRIARWNGTAWRALGAGLAGMATAIAHDGDTVYASNYDEGLGAYMLGAFNGTSWRELGSRAAGLTPSPAFNFNALRPITGGVLAIGQADLDDNSGRGALFYDIATQKFHALGTGGVHAVIATGVAVTHNDIWVAGAIAEAGSGASATPSVGLARFVLQR